MKQDEREFERIYRDHAALVRRLVFRLCHPNDLDDLVQLVFVKVYEGLERLRESGSLKPWICRIAVNVARDDLRRRRTRGWLSLFRAEEPQEAASPAPTAEQAMGAGQELRAFVGGLTPKLQEVIVLFSVEELEMKEIADTLAIPVGTVKSRLNEARKKLGSALREESDE